MKIKVVAMPGVSDSTNFGFSDEGKNRRLAKRTLNNITETFWETDSHIFYRSGNWEESGYIILYNKDKKLITYVVNFEVNSPEALLNFKESVTQVMVWKATMDEQTTGLASKVFFDILLKQYKAIMSDSIQTFEGKRFWEQMLDRANNRGFNLAFIDYNTQQVYPKPKKEHIEKWVKKWDAWGKEEHHEKKKFLIFKD